MISRIKYLLEHSRISFLVPFLRKSGLVHFLHLLKEGKERRENTELRKGFERFYRLHRQEFAEAEKLFADELSRETLRRVVSFRIRWRMRELKGIIKDRQYFQKDIFGPVENEVFIDGGAYVGDTIEGLFMNFGGGGTTAKKFMHGSRIPAT